MKQLKFALMMVFLLFSCAEVMEDQVAGPSDPLDIAPRIGNSTITSTFRSSVEEFGTNPKGSKDFTFSMSFRREYDNESDGTLYIDDAEISLGNAKISSHEDSPDLLSAIPRETRFDAKSITVIGKDGPRTRERNEKFAVVWDALREARNERLTKAVKAPQKKPVLDEMTSDEILKYFTDKGFEVTPAEGAVIEISRGRGKMKFVHKYDTSSGKTIGSDLYLEGKKVATGEVDRRAGVYKWTNMGNPRHIVTSTRPLGNKSK